MVVQHFFPRLLLPALFLLRPCLPYRLPRVLRLRGCIHSGQNVTLLSSFCPFHPFVVLFQLAVDGDGALDICRDGLILHNFILEDHFAGRVVLRRRENASIVDERLVLDQLPLDVVPFLVSLCAQLLHC